MKGVSCKERATTLAQSQGRAFQGPRAAVLLFRSLFGSSFLGWLFLGGRFFLRDGLFNDSAEFRLLIFALEIIGATAAFDDFV